MIIQNSEHLGRTRKIQHCLSILERGVAAADPKNILPAFLERRCVRIGDRRISLDRYDSVHTVSFGKAADSMSRAASRILPVKSGMIVVPHGLHPQTKGYKMRVYKASHPYPDRYSVAAAKAVIKFVKNRRQNEFVLFLVSGGTSSLLSLPDGVSLSDKMHAIETLMRHGATISEINCVRKHISRIKGGLLLSNAVCDGASLIMSDVENDDPGAIASGTTYMDKTTFADALDIIDRYDTSRRIHPSIVSRLQAGSNGVIPETPKEVKMPHCVIANNMTCIRAMTEHAQRLGYGVETARCFGDVGDIRDMLAAKMPEKGTCLIFGGEPTVRVTGKGKGGRNQELVLRLQTMGMGRGTVVASMGTDGIDGNSRAAGAVVQGPAKDGPTARSYLANNDSYGYFRRYGGAIMTGHTHTNLLDIGMILP